MCSSDLKCTPCREGTYWITGMLEKFEHGKGLENELSVINDVCSQIAGRSFCALGDAAATPFPGAMKYFADEFKQATRVPVDLTFPPQESTIFECNQIKTNQYHQRHPLPKTSNQIGKAMERLDGKRSTPARCHMHQK